MMHSGLLQRVTLGLTGNAVRRGAARLGGAGFGSARHGTGQGGTRHGWAWTGGARNAVRLGKPRQVDAGHDMARNKAWHGVAGKGRARNKDRGATYQRAQHYKEAHLSATSIFLGGIPTAPDVKRLREFFPDNELKVGQIIPYNEVEQVLGCNRHSYRHKTVTTRWRRLVEKESNVIIGTEAGKGFVILDDHQKLDLSGSKLRSAAKLARRSYVVSSYIDRRNLNDEELQRLDHQGKVSSAVLAAATIKRNAQLPTI